MAKKYTYSVSVIREGRDRDYRDFWDRNQRVNESGEVLHSDLVGFTETVDANNLNDAISSVEKKYPNLRVVREYSSKL